MAPQKKKRVSAKVKAPAKNGTRTAVKASAKPKTKRRIKANASDNKKNNKDPDVGYVPGELPYPMKIRGNLHLRFKAAAAELGQAQAELQAAKAVLDVLRTKPVHTPVFQAMQVQLDLQNDVMTKRKEFADVQLEVGEKLGIPAEKLQEYTFDTITGVVLPNPPRSTKQ